LWFWERLLDLQRQPVGVLGAERDDQSEPLVAQPPQHEGHHPGRGPIQPLQIIDADHDWRVGGDRTQNLQRGKRHGQLIDGGLLGLPAQQRNLQGTPLRGRQLRKSRLEHALKQVDQPSKGQGRLGLGGAGGQHRERTSTGGLQRRLPHGGLADPRRPLHHHRAGASHDRVQHGGQLVELGLAAEHHGRHQSPILGPA
jgi:hypothetical protein